MRMIHKQTIDIWQSIPLKVPAKSTFLDIQVQHGNITVWYEFDTADRKTLVERTIQCEGTGIPFERSHKARYFKTVQVDGGRFVWHFYVYDD